MAHLIGSGGESEVFLVKDKNGKAYTAKYWTIEKSHDHMRGANHFKNLVKVHALLNPQSHMLHLYRVFGDSVVILGYLKGKELKGFRL